MIKWRFKTVFNTGKERVETLELPKRYTYDMVMEFYNKMSDSSLLIQKDGKILYSSACKIEATQVVDETNPVLYSHIDLSGYDINGSKITMDLIKNTDTPLFSSYTSLNQYQELLKQYPTLKVKYVFRDEDSLKQLKREKGVNI